MTIAALVVALLGCAFILFIGGRFLLAPKVAMTGFGVPEDSLRALASIKGVRDITSGVVPLVVLAAAGIHVFGWGIKAPAGSSLVGVAIVMLVILLLRPSGITGGKEFSLPRSLHGRTSGPEPPAPAPDGGV